MRASHLLPLLLLASCLEVGLPSAEADPAPGDACECPEPMRPTLLGSEPCGPDGFARIVTDVPLIGSHAVAWQTSDDADRGALQRPIEIQYLSAVVECAPGDLERVELWALVP
jgi:hypothetical protein